MSTIDKVQNGDVLLFEGRGLYSAVIRARTRSTITHAGIAVVYQAPIGIDYKVRRRILVIEAHADGGVDVNSIEQSRKGSRRIWHYGLDESIDRDAVVAHALDQCGDAYAEPRQFVRSWILPRWIRDKLGLAPDSAVDRWHCSELVFSSLIAGGFQPSEPIDAAAVAPVDLRRLEILTHKGEVCLQ